MKILEGGVEVQKNEGGVDLLLAVKTSNMVVFADDGSGRIFIGARCSYVCCEVSALYLNLIYYLNLICFMILVIDYNS